MVTTIIAYVAVELGISVVAATFVVNFAVSLIVTRIFAENPETQQDMGVRQQVPPSAVNAIPIVYGNAYMGGTFIDAVLTTDQKTMYYVLAISSISPNGQFTYDTADMYYGDRKIGFGQKGTLQSATVFNGGTGYIVGEILTITGGSGSSPATVIVTSVGATGNITGVNVNTVGSYTSAPLNPAYPVAGTGSDASFTLNFSENTNVVVSLTDEAANVDTKIYGNLYINLYTSDAIGTIVSANYADAPTVVMGGSDIAVAQRWVSTTPAPRKMNGLAFAIVKLVYNQDANTTQLSAITFKVKQALNGTGVAKAGDVWYDYMTNAVYGGAVDAAFVNSTSATALNAYGDQNITFTNSSGAPSTQPRYRINGVLDAGQSVLSNVDRIVSACDSWMTYNAALGQWSVVINKAESTAYAFNDNNIIGEIRVSATDITSSINQVEARFPFKENRDQAAFVNIETPSGLLYPNEPVNKYSITYDMVNDSVQAQYLANRLLEQAREDLIVGFSTTYYGIQVDAGDVVSVTNSDYGWNAKLFRVMKVNEASLPDGGLGARLELSEYNAQVYDDANITQFTPIPNSGLASVSYFSPLAAPTVTGFPSATIPYIDVQVFVPTTGRVTFGNLFWTTSATPSAGDWKLVSNASTTNGQPVTNGSYYTFANITLNTGTYYFAYMVGNDVTSSVLSPISAALVWNPVAGAGPTGPTGATGTTGGSGDSVDIIFKRSATQPATPSPSVGTPATWYSDVNSVPAGTDPIWSSVGTNTGTGTNYTWQTPLLIEGQNGNDGLSVAELLIYIRATSTPSTPTGGSYNFTTQTLTAPTSWFSYVPSGTDPVYTSRSVASIQGTTGTDSSLTWTTPILSFQNGATGPTGITGPTGASVTGPNGLLGLSSLTAYRVQAQNATTPTFTTPTTGATAPSGWSLTAPSVAVGQVLWYIMGRYNANAVTVDGVAAGQTAWTGPVAASIFQDIRSDNWNGSNPPVFGTTGTYGTAGYYIQQSTGDVFFNNGIFRANINTSGDAVFLGDNTTTTNFPIYDSLYYVDYSVLGQGTTSASLGNVRAGVLGTATSTGSVWNAGVIGYASNASSVVGSVGIGVVGSGYSIGGYFSTYPSAGIALVCTAASSSFIAFQINQGKFNWGAYSIPQPTGSTTTFLRNDGTWATPSGGGSGTVTSVSGTGTVSGLSLSGTVTTSGNLTLGGTLSVTQSDLIASAPSSAYYLSGSGWNSVSPIMTAAITNSGTATVSGNNLNILGSTSTGIVGAYVGTSGSGNTVTIDVRTTSPSDVRLKEEIADSDLGLAFVKQLRPVSYKLKADSKHQKGYGFIADEVDQIIESGSSLVYFEPDWKVGEEKGFKTIHYPSYIAVLTKAIQELSAQVEELKKQIPKV